MQPNPLKAAAEKLLFFLLRALVAACGVVVVVSLEKVERSRAEMVDLQRVDWICGFGSVSEMGWW